MSLPAITRRYPIARGHEGRLYEMDAARELAPEHPMLKDIDRLEAQLRKLFPDHF